MKNLLSTGLKIFVGRFSFARQMLAWDSLEFTNNVERSLESANTDVVIVPGGCTKYIPALDVSWSKTFKAHMAERYDKWLSDGVHTFTHTENMKPVPRHKIVKWVFESWDGGTSFKSCALNICFDGSEDNKISCFKERNACSVGVKLLQD